MHAMRSLFEFLAFWHFALPASAKLPEIPRLHLDLIEMELWVAKLAKRRAIGKAAFAKSGRQVN
ncbi:hypothetical protein [Bosea sp. (in: a-proteobacteria)]|uniref:hypothetical protein n=1 Tax=Bosea sp. (in: a-proteobacteria) TaxID=1871050 RepID=UPI0026132730|nr:hypothetical protein [Bosea sp. (in: a-proteobacteria)]MCO5089455.1 hypothetical protein [Bosea sp. (in: a-proteobacteria)]